jgi:hypothetical protein
MPDIQALPEPDASGLPMSIGWQYRPGRTRIAQHFFAGLQQ